MSRTPRSQLFDAPCLAAVALCLSLPACSGDDGDDGDGGTGAATAMQTGADGSPTGNDDRTDTPDDEGPDDEGPDDEGPDDGPDSGGTTAGDGSDDAATAGSGSSSEGPPIELDDFSFFMTSLEGLQELSGDPMGFGGNLTFEGAVGIDGADLICETLAEMSMPGAATKGWRAFLSTSVEDAIDRIGQGPWYDRSGRLISNDLEGLMQDRPDGDPAAVADFPNEYGVPNSMDLDNHDTMTASGQDGRLVLETNGGPGGGGPLSTCMDWTSAEPGQAPPMMGHSWPAQSGQNWIAVGRHGTGCEALVWLEQTGANCNGQFGVGCGGGYGGFYCFALEP